MPDTKITLTVVWSGQSSNENTEHTSAACGPRQQVGAGTYTLQAVLSGHKGTSSTFTVG